ncbi:hypothetical protein [Acidiphilium sp.]|uniref:hypothetical protein n=1 Tax=Acidiphilium sp. TaxID=527 RepID=UPI003D03250E
MTLYVRNTTRQAFEFNVRLPEMKRVFTLKLHPKKTREIDNFSPEQTAAMIEHMVAHGAVDRKKISVSLADYSGVIYSTDRGIKDDDVLAGYEATLDNAQDRSVKEATRAAISAGATQIENTNAKEAEIEMAQEHDMGRLGKKAMRISVDAGMARNASDRLPV